MLPYRLMLLTHKTRSFGILLSPVTLSAHVYSTSELLRTLLRNGCFYANLLAVFVSTLHFTLKQYFGTLADGLGCFPFDYEPCRTQSHSYTLITGIQSLIGFGRR